MRIEGSRLVVARCRVRMSTKTNKEAVDRVLQLLRAALCDMRIEQIEVLSVASRAVFPNDPLGPKSNRKDT